VAELREELSDPNRENQKEAVKKGALPFGAPVVGFSGPGRSNRVLVGDRSDCGDDGGQRRRIALSKRCEVHPD
jgi:hypothetical protein